MPILFSKNKKQFNNNSQSSEKEICDIISIDSPCSNIKGFLSSERRFNSTGDNNINNKTSSPGVDLMNQNLISLLITNLKINF